MGRSGVVDQAGPVDRQQSKEPPGFLPDVNRVILTAVLVSICLLAAVVTYGLGIYVFSRHPASLVNRLFFASMLATTYWAFGEFMIWQSAGPEGVAFWLKASAFWPFAIAFWFHFLLVFTGHTVSRGKSALFLFVFIYLPATAITLAGLYTDLLFVVAFIPGTGYTYVPAEAGPENLLESLYLLAVMVA